MRQLFSFAMVTPMTSTEEDIAIIKGCLANDRRSWNAFVSQYTRYVYFMIEATRARYGASLNDEDKADLHANIFLGFIENNFRRLREFEGRNQCSLRSWIRLITVRKTIDQLRKKHPRQISMEILQEKSGFEPQAAEDDPLSQLITAQDNEHRPDLESLVAELSETDRLLLKFFLVDKLSAPNVAQALNISVGAVYTRKNRLIERLRALRKKSETHV